MHVYKFVHGGDFNNHDDFDFTRLFMHGYKFLNAIFKKMKT